MEGFGIVKEERRGVFKVMVYFCFKTKMKFILLLSFIPFSCKAQKDSVDHYMPYLIHNQDIVGNYSWARPLFKNDTIFYKVIVEDSALGIKVRNDTLGITYRLALILDTYSVWVEKDKDFGDHWEMYLGKRRIRDLPIKVLVIDEVPILKGVDFHSGKN